MKLIRIGKLDRVLLVQEDVHYMKQMLTRHGFLELFTEDDMNINTMRDLLKQLSTKNEKVYRYQKEECTTKLRESVCSPSQPMCVCNLGSILTDRDAPLSFICFLQTVLDF